VTTESLIGLGWAAFGFFFVRGSMEIFDAWKYRDHPNESVTREAKHWALVWTLWLLSIGGAYWI